MRKKINKQKDIKTADKKHNARPSNPAIMPSPFLTMVHLQGRTDCLQKVREFQKVRIDRIIQGNTIESIAFEQIQKNCSFEQFIGKYFTFSETTNLFTDLITKNSLVSDITFMDFKIKNFKIMNTYSTQVKQYRDSQGKSGSKVTASSSIKKSKHFKQMEYVVKRITKNRVKSIANVSNISSKSSINMLTKNIEKMIKNIKYQSAIQDKNRDDKPVIFSSKQFCFTNISKIQQERLHTSPETNAFDAYGLQGPKHKYNKKTFQSSQSIKNINNPVKGEKAKDNHRFQTEYDTAYIKVNKSKSSKSKFSKPKLNVLCRMKSSQSFKHSHQCKK